ncbi:hypothetical protein NDU88_000034 [Pleurodeles waltl]|uniref:Uncharacterized protein n=1 Tax=Pleurodeles waltl TaxID=8319 RepID=A0AAV7MFQ5_PLEWA|nr:hypothetical protein NDU88_000034 [Pleurodeles waltl]
MDGTAPLSLSPVCLRTEGTALLALLARCVYALLARFVYAGMAQLLSLLARFVYALKARLASHSWPAMDDTPLVALLAWFDYAQ